MGKGSNVQKKEAARDRNLKDKSKTPEERAAATKKAKADAEVRRAVRALLRCETRHSLPPAHRPLSPCPAGKRLFGLQADIHHCPGPRQPAKGIERPLRYQAPWREEVRLLHGPER